MWMIFAALLAAAETPPAPTPTPTPISLLAPSSAGTSSRPGSLAELARRIKLRLPEGSEGRTITNESLKTLATGVELTIAKAGPPVDTEGAEQADAEAEQKQAYWQERYWEAQAELEQAEAEVRRLEAETARLQNEFYSTDDPALRDGVVKPAWDQALADLQAARERLEQARTGPDKVRDEALRNGALPGWFRGTAPRRPTTGGAVQE